MTYKEQYKNIKSATIELVKTFIKDKRAWNKPSEELNKNYIELLEKLSLIYGIETPQLKVLSISEIEGFYGCYSPIDNIIVLPKYSLVTLLHEFKHALQHHKNKINNEEVARGWSISLFYLSSEKAYNNAVRKGLLFYE